MNRRHGGIWTHVDPENVAVVREQPQVQPDSHALTNCNAHLEYGRNRDQIRPDVAHVDRKRKEQPHQHEDLSAAGPRVRAVLHGADHEAHRETVAKKNEHAHDLVELLPSKIFEE